MEKNIYTTGELAKLTKVSYKTIRYYQEIGLLQAEEIGANGYRLYGIKSVEVLQRILLLKYLNFSLDEIKEMIWEENILDNFRKQEELLLEQREHIDRLLQGIVSIQKEELNWKRILNIIHMTQEKEEIVKQYKSTYNLESRISIHDYSTNKTSWYQWVLDGLELKEGMNILELGCGNGMLWSTMMERLPKNITICMMDNSIKMIEAAQRNLEKLASMSNEKNIKFIFIQQDVEELEVKGFHGKEVGLKENDFHRIIANHFLYHISNEKRPGLINFCANKLKKEGMLYVSTVGESHLRELFKLVISFDKNIEIPSKMTKNFVFY